MKGENNLDELKLGKVTNAELASWFDTTESNLSHKKKKFLEKLKTYCEFKLYRGGVEIIKIYKPFYIKNQNYKIVEENFDNYWDESGLDTCAHVGSQIYEDFHNQLTVKENTTIKHTAQVRDAKYNKPSGDDVGPEGKCYYVLCKKDGEKPVWLNSEQDKIKQELLNKWFKGADEKTVIVQDMINSGEITEEGAWKTYSNLMKLPKSYPGFMAEYKKRTGIQLIRGTFIVKNNEESIEWEEKEKFDF